MSTTVRADEFDPSIKLSQVEAILAVIADDHANDLRGMRYVLGSILQRLGGCDDLLEMLYPETIHDTTARQAKAPAFPSSLLRHAGTRGVSLGRVAQSNEHARELWADMLKR
jgi:hypothetical protein